MSGKKTRQSDFFRDLYRAIPFALNYTKHCIFSSITRRILFLNLTALAVLVLGILYLNQFSESLIGAKMESLMTQGEIIAGAISASVQIETDSITVDPEKLLELQAKESSKSVDLFDNLEFLINPERIAPVLRRLISPMHIRARLYDREANLFMDSRHLYSRGQVLYYDLPVIENESVSWVKYFEKGILNFFGKWKVFTNNGESEMKDKTFEAVILALRGTSSTLVRKNAKGEQIISVAVPIRRFHFILGVLVLSTEGGDIDRIIANERNAILRVFGVAALVNSVLSILLASTIASPLRRLSETALRIRSGVRTREEIPDFSGRQDEIGSLSLAMKNMTMALYARIEAIERFAADVSHELKNPLTSLRSAVEALPLVKTREIQARLTKIIQHDVQRLDRLITDISDASRLDAELAREDYSCLDLKEFLTNLISALIEGNQRKKDIKINFISDPFPHCLKGYYVMGHDLRLAQVITNLIENARSFVPQDNGRIDIKLWHSGKFNFISVSDNGSGICIENIERIFERFYTDRPESDTFGQNSGLGLSISRQIIEAHGGELKAENIFDSQSQTVYGARFVISLPAVL